MNKRMNDNEIFNGNELRVFGDLASVDICAQQDQQVPRNSLYLTDAEIDDFDASVDTMLDNLAREYSTPHPTHQPKEQYTTSHVINERLREILSSDYTPHDPTKDFTPQYHSVQPLYELTPKESHEVFIAELGSQQRVLKKFDLKNPSRDKDADPLFAKYIMR